MELECKNCCAIVEAEELFVYFDNDPNDGMAGKWTLCKCPKCTLPLLALQVDFGSGFEGDAPVRVYPPQGR
jgi:hypothetical protein